MAKPSRQERILVVDDSADTLEVVRRNLGAAGYRTLTCRSVPEAVGILDANPVDLVVTDLKMPKGGGMDLVRHVRENLKDTEVIMITGYSSIGGAVEAVKAGAEEYLPKPFTDEELQAAVRRALDNLRLRRAGQAAPGTAPAAPYGIVGESPALQKVFGALRKAAASTATVLITGESGTGKELVARAIHYTGARSAASFVPVNCGSIPEGLLEAELFGHVKGAFTGATESRAGFFHAADGGTIFLDEVSEMMPAMQVKFLRVLEGREICMVGSSRPRKVDVRILAATNKDLPALVGKGIFREDLFYRLNVLTIHMPPLRDRGDDVLLLARHFARKYAAETGKPPPRFSDEALRVLRDYAWPGNVRELENVMRRLVVMSEAEVVEIPDLPSLMRFSALRKNDFSRPLADVEADYIRNVLESVDGNKARAAKMLGINRKTLREKLKRMGEGSGGKNEI